MNDPIGTKAKQEIDRTAVRDRQDVWVDGDLMQPLNNSAKVLGPTLSARDDVVGVEALEGLKLGWVSAAALIDSQAFEDPEASLGEAWLFDMGRQAKILRCFFAAGDGAAVDRVKGGRVKVDPFEVSSLAFGKTFFADPAEDPASIERSHSVS